MTNMTLPMTHRGGGTIELRGQLPPFCRYRSRFFSLCGVHYPAELRESYEQGSVDGGMFKVLFIIISKGVFARTVA